MCAWVRARERACERASERARARASESASERARVSTNLSPPPPPPVPPRPAPRVRAQPENLLIDAEGYLKIVDFGFAKQVADRTYTLCGTPEYLAPELVLGRGHDKGVDYWALGILLYEQVAGYSPFADHDNDDQMVICKNILRGEVNFPAHVKDAKLKDLVSKLLVKDIPRRLGCMRGGAADVKAHPFFRELDWPALLSKTLAAPWRPKLANALDTSNFDQYDEDDSCEPFVDTTGVDWAASF